MLLAIAPEASLVAGGGVLIVRALLGRVLEKVLKYLLERVELAYLQVYHSSYVSTRHARLHFSSF